MGNSYYWGNRGRTWIQWIVFIIVAILFIGIFIYIEAHQLETVQIYDAKGNCYYVSGPRDDRIVLKGKGLVCEGPNSMFSVDDGEDETGDTTGPIVYQEGNGPKECFSSEGGELTLEPCVEDDPDQQFTEKDGRITHEDAETGEDRCLSSQLTRESLADGSNAVSTPLCDNNINQRVEFYDEDEIAERNDTEDELKAEDN
jgi:hypothetical protein